MILNVIGFFLVFKVLVAQGVSIKFLALTVSCSFGKCVGSKTRFFETCLKKQNISFKTNFKQLNIFPIVSPATLTWRASTFSRVCSQLESNVHCWYFYLNGGGFYSERPKRMHPVVTLAHFTGSHSLQVGLPRCRKRSQSATCILRGSAPNDSETLWKTGIRGHFNSQTLLAGLFGRGGGGCAVARARSRAPPGKPNSRRLLAEFRLTPACHARLPSLPRSDFKTVGGKQVWKLADVPPTESCVAQPRCGVFWGVYHLGQLLASADWSLASARRPGALCLQDCKVPSTFVRLF